MKRRLLLPLLVPSLTHSHFSNEVHTHQRLVEYSTAFKPLSYQRLPRRGLLALLLLRPQARAAYTLLTIVPLPPNPSQYEDYKHFYK